MARWWKPYKHKKNWKEYNEELVIRGKMLFDLDFSNQRDEELKRMNKGKRGITLPVPGIIHEIHDDPDQYLDYRSLEGMVRSMAGMGIIPVYGDYTTVWNRIHGMKPALTIFQDWSMLKQVPMVQS